MDGVTVVLAGTFRAERGGSPAGRGIGGGKARRLLVLLAVERPRLVPTDRIIEALWPADPPRRPTENVATLVSRLRVVLGAEAIEGGRDGYRIGPAPAVRVDLDEAARLVAESGRRLAEGAPALAAAAAAAALDVLGTAGVLVGEPDTEWVRRARTEADALLREARHAAAVAACRVGDAAVARAAAEAAVAADRLDEAAHRLLMTAHQLAGEPARALAGYDRLRADLAAELGVDPDPETRAVHLAILRGQHTTDRGQHTTDPGPVRTPREPERADLVGRSAEVARLTAAWSAACTGDAAVVLVAGEGGIGKTRLVAELAALAASTGGVVLQSRCYASERSLFLQPFVDALAGPLTAMPTDRLRELAGSRAPALVGLLPELEAVLGHAGAERGSAEFEVRRAYDAVGHVLRGLAAHHPVLLVVDDLHNAGLATVELLHHLARHLAGVRLLVLVTVRAEEGAAALDALADVTVRCDLGPLSADAVSRLAGDAGQPEHAATILRRTRGHTLFVVETLRGLAVGEVGAPESLREAVLARLRRAGPATEEVLRAAAVLGAVVDPATVADMVGLAPHVAAQRCEVAAAARLLVPAGPSYEFANDLVQEVLYATMPVPTRVAHHRRAAELLVRWPESVAAHAVAAQDWPQAAEALLRAVADAAGRFAVADAEALAGRAVEAAGRSGDPGLLGRAHLARGQARVVLARYPGALTDHRAALAAAREIGDRRLEMATLRQLGGHGGIAGGASIGECTVWIEEGLGIAQALDDRGMQARFLAWLAVISSNRLRFDDAVGYGTRAVAAGRAAGEPAALAAGLDGLKNAHAYLGELGPLAVVLDELEPLVHRLGDLDVLQWVVFESAFAAIGAGDWAGAELRISDAIAISRRGGFALHDGWFAAHLGWLARLQGRYDAALDHGRQAVQLTACADHRWFGPLTVSQLGTTLIELGRAAEAVPLLTAARAAAERDGAESYLLRCLAPLAEATASVQLLEEADALLAGITAPAGAAWLLGTDAYLAIARGWLRHGAADRARAVLAPLLAAAGRQHWVPALACGALVDGRAAAALGDIAAARAALQRSACLARRHGLPFVERAATDALAAVPSTGARVARGVPPPAVHASRASACGRPGGPSGNRRG